MTYQRKTRIRPLLVQRPAPDSPEPLATPVLECHWPTCQHRWVPRSAKTPVRCPGCQRKNWQTGPATERWERCPKCHEKWLRKKAGDEPPLRCPRCNARLRHAQVS